MRRLAVILRRCLWLAAVGAVLASSAGLVKGTSGRQEDPPPPEVQKPRYDYMSNFLSRSTRPLGLKEDPVARELLSQGPVKWAIRAGSRHVLN